MSSDGFILTAQTELDRTFSECGSRDVSSTGSSRSHHDHLTVDGVITFSVVAAQGHYFNVGLLNRTFA